MKSWTAADLRYLTDYANHQNVRGIAEALGRSSWSVVRKLQELGLSVAVSRESQAVYSLRDLRQALHVRHSTVLDWIAEGKLVVAITKRTLKRGHQQRVKEEDLMAFLTKYQDELNLAKTEPHIQLLVEEFLKSSLNGKSRGAGA